MHEWTREEHIADVLRDDPSTPRTAEIIGTYYWRESRGTVDDDRDIIEPMRSFERENATLKSELTAAKQSREQVERDALRRADEVCERQREKYVEFHDDDEGRKFRVRSVRGAISYCIEGIRALSQGNVHTTTAGSNKP